MSVAGGFIILPWAQEGPSGPAWDLAVTVCSLL